MALGAGARLGAYEIVSPLGAGGMGEVYKARDTRLDRVVAIKVLPAAMAADPQFRERFEREARAISQLSHPHICILYDVGRQDDSDFLVLEYLEGETLAARLQKGPMPIADAVRTAAQIADALACAHQAAIVHRDLKPANVLLTRTGVKLLDFGLAKTDAVQMGGRDGVSAAATVPPALTAQGTILGTLQYMAPEQVEGQDADARADIWAFGAILHEMITGRPAFEGRNPATLVASVLTHQPAPLRQMQPAAPRTIERIVDGCLEKDREQRWQNIRDVGRQLAAADIVDDGAPVVTSKARGPRPIVPIAGGALILAAGVAAGFLLDRARAPAQAGLSLVRFEIPPPAGLSIPYFSDTSIWIGPSPDGARVVFAAGGRLWMKALDRASPEVIAGTEGASSPFWSPDGRSLAFFAGGQLKKKAIDGGPPQVVCAALGSGNNGAWSARGVIVFSEWGLKRLSRVSADGGTPAVLRTGADFGWPEFLPDSRHYLFNSNGPDAKTLMVGDVDSEQIATVPGVESQARYAAGHLLFRRDGALLAQPFDVSRLRLTGAPLTIADFVSGFVSTGGASFATGGSHLLVYQSIREANQLVWVDRDGRDLETIGQPNQYTTLRLSPDGSKLALTVRDPQLGTNDIWLHDFKRNIDSRLTSERTSENSPVWSPDGRTIVYSADRLGPPHLHARDVSGSDERQITPPTTAVQAPTAITPDSRFVVYADTNPDTGADILLAPLDGNGPPVALVRTKAREVIGRPSPDGKWLAYVSNQSGRPEVHVRPFGDDQTRWQVSRAGGSNPKWRGDGRELFYVEGGSRLMSVDVTAVATFEVSAPRVLFSRASFTDYDVAADGKRFVFSMLDPAATAGTLSAILNWPALLNGKK